MATKNDMTTYALVSYEMQSHLARLAQRDDITVLNYTNGRATFSLEQAGQKIQHKNVNVMLLAHGEAESGMFFWDGPNKIRTYSDFFEALPKDGIRSIAINSCYGGQSESALKHAPAGAVVIALTGAKTASWNSHTLDYIRETKNLDNPIDLYIKALDNFDPASFQRMTRHHNKEHRTNDDANPVNAMPRLIGIGGRPPIPLDLDAVTSEISKPMFAPAGWERSVTRVKSLFDTQHYISYGQNYTAQSGNDAAEKNLDRRIDSVADNIRKGKPMPDGDELSRAEYKRIAYALSAAYLDESGKIERMRVQLIAREPQSLAEAVRLKAPMGSGQQNAAITKEIETFGKAIGAKIDTDGRLSADEINEIQRKLGYRHLNGRMSDFMAEDIVGMKKEMGLSGLPSTPRRPPTSNER